MQFSGLVKGFPADKPIFVTKRIYNSTVNSFLEEKCKLAGIPIISVHGLRHTHASLLLRWCFDCKCGQEIGTC